MVSMNSIHFERWTDQLKDAGHQVYWFNITDGGYSKKLSWVHQITGWKQKFPKLKGRVFMKKYFPRIYRRFSFFIERNLEAVFEKTLIDVKPDIVHSFALYVSCAPILSVMQKYSNIKWIYSSWGSDLFYFQHNPSYLRDIKAVLPRANYLFTDCKRDVQLAKIYGFQGEVLGVFPGGGGYSIDNYNGWVQSVNKRKKILVKGYQGRSGRAIPVLKALNNLKESIEKYEIVVFGADLEVQDFIAKLDMKNTLKLTVNNKSSFMPHEELMQHMGEALIYIGNSNSDGMPNTLLEAIIMGAFPIQSNPGGATEEVVTHNKNGLLIIDCEDSDDIALQIENAIKNKTLLNNAFEVNQKLKVNFDRQHNTDRVIKAYNSILNS